MIKWKYSKENKENILQVMDVTKSNNLIWLDRLEDERIHFYGLLVKTRKLKASWSLEAAKDVNSMFGLDYGKAIAEQIREECDKEILKKLKDLANRSKIMKKVFLGGTCAESTWREEFEKRLEIDYFNPVVDDWDEKAYQQELIERENCDYCLYVITPKMMGVYSIAEVIDDSNKRPEKTIFCFLDLDDNEEFKIPQIKSLTNVGKMVEKNGGHWFKSIDECINFLNGDESA